MPCHHITNYALTHIYHYNLIDFWKMDAIVHIDVNLN